MPKKKSKKDLRNESLGLSIVLLATLMTGMQSVTIKVGYSLELSILVMLVLRKVIFLPCYSLYLFRQFKPSFIFARHHAKYVLLAMATGAVGNYLLPLLSMMALKQTSAAVVTIIIFTYPLFVIFFNAVIQRIMPPPIHLVTFVLIQIGIYMLLGGGSANITANLYGASLALTVSVLFAAVNIVMNIAARKLGTRRFVFHALLAALVVSLIHFLIIDVPSSLLVSPKQFAFVVFFAAVCFAPLFMLTEGVQRIGVPRTALINSLSPFLTMIYAYFILGEVLTEQQIAGGLIVVLSILLLEKELLRFFIPRYKRRTTPISTPD